jgi:hypothetical protein
MIELSAISGLSCLLPLSNLMELIDLFEAIEKRVVAERIELVPAKVVGAALHIANLERTKERFKERDVLEVELFLQVFGASGDDDSLVPLTGKAKGRQKVRKCLPRPRPGFNNQMTLLLESGLNSACHVVLPLTMLKSQRRSRENASGSEEITEIRQILRLRGRNRDGSGRRQGDLLEDRRHRGFAISIIEGEAKN